MFGLGFWELAVILALVILVFGAKRLPGLGEALGRTIKELRRASSGLANPPADASDKKETVSESAAERFLPELKEVRKVKSTLDKIRNFSPFHWLR